MGVKIHQFTGFHTNGPMPNIGWNIIGIARPYGPGFVGNGNGKGPTGYITHLRMQWL